MVHGLQCAARLARPPGLRAHLERHDGVEELTDSTECLILSLHVGPHLAFGQLEASLDNRAVDDLWLCWNDTATPL